MRTLASGLKAEKDLRWQGRMGDTELMDEPRSRRKAPGKRTPSLARKVLGLGLGGLAGFQLALAIGAPWGRASYGGAHPGVLPGRLRTVSAGASVLYSGLALAVASERTPTPCRRPILTGVAGVMGVGAVVNGSSPSLPERAIWTPTATVLALSAWRARRAAGSEGSATPG